jgi:hypothetical protein
MVYPREVLNAIKWRTDRNFNLTEIWYVHRGAPNDIKIISGKEIQKLTRDFFITKDATIPYHRIIKIIYDGQEVWGRK